MIDKPLYQNPLGGGQQGPLDLSKMNKNPYNSEFIGIGKDQTNLFGYKVPDYVIKEQEEYRKKNPINMYNMTPPNELSSQLIVDPNATAQKKADEEFLKTADEYQRGFRESEFYKPGGAMTADMAEFIYSSPTRGDITMKGSSSGIGQFKSYLDSIGKGDLLQRAGGSFSQETGPLATVGPNVGNEIVPYNPDAGQGVGLDGKPLLDGGPSLFPFPGMDSTEVASAETQPYNRVGQQLTGPNQDDILGTLKNIEQGIASLGQGDMNQSSFGGFNNNFGIGSFFPPYGGMYGK